jgi:hypothetical protein
MPQDLPPSGGYSAVQYKVGLSHAVRHIKSPFERDKERMEKGCFEGEIDWELIGVYVLMSACRETSQREDSVQPFY